MKIVYWSDFVCPYCYIAEVRLIKAIKEMGLEKEAELIPMAFQLDPNAPNVPLTNTAERFAAKYRLPLVQAEAQIEHISQQGRNEGIDFKYATTQFTNTFNAHRLLKLALSKQDKEIADKLNELLFAAYFTKNLRLAEDSVLIEAGMMAGLEEKEIVELLKSNMYGDEVRADELAAAKQGVHGVPYFIFPGNITIPGAVSTTDFKEILKRARLNEKSGASMRGQECGSDGCKVNF